jgi:hypothetical protein
VVPTAIVNAAQCSTDDGTDEFTQLLNARQAKALAEAE